MSEVSLNLARKWRSRNFDQVIGQLLSVRMLKNSLYLGHYFPVYLFSGQRGCGKTTTARIFAGALNCERLAMFQKQPQTTVLPCLSCASCNAMRAGKHPDFIEIDAASHTGVEHVRTIIDAASLLPLMGQKKIYLIDEAHMLSKAAFNAFLKILEEPPLSTLFILATTDPQKIIDTVRSRCFQLLFRPLENAEIGTHLEKICQEETIAYEKEALEHIARETEGSVRDAINMLEQVRFAAPKVTKEAVLQLLGHVDEERIVHLFACIIQGDYAALLSLLRAFEKEQQNCVFVWHQLLLLVRTALRLKYQANTDDFFALHQKIRAIIQHCSIERLHAIMERLYAHELLVTKSGRNHMALLEMVLLQLSVTLSSDPESEGGASSQQTAGVELVLEEIDEEEFVDEDEEDSEDDQEDEFKGKWATFLAGIDSLKDPLISSVFKQGLLENVSVETKKVSVSFAKDFIFFKGWLEETRGQWEPFLITAFGNGMHLEAHFTQEVKELQASSVPRIAAPVKPDIPPALQNATRVAKQQPAPAAWRQPEQRTWSSPKREKQNPVNIPDAAAWPTAHLLLRYFPGTIYENKGV